VNLTLMVPGSLVVHTVRGKAHVLETHAASVRGPRTWLSKG
jgi:hypothetical protein